MQFLILYCKHVKMLYIIGIGLDKKDISLRGIEALKRCKKVYLENYTSDFPYSIRELEKVIRKRIIQADREFVEIARLLLAESKKSDIALLVSGDPLSATTHIDLLLRAEKQEIRIEIIHSSSIFTAVGDSGLQLYKLGKTASLPKFYPNFRPESFYDVIKANQKIDAHTLILLDIGLSVNDALFQLKEVMERKDEKLDKILVCERAGTKKNRFYYDYLDKFIKKKFKLPSCIIIPSKLHFMEEVSLKRFS